LHIGSLIVTAGWVSFLSITIKLVLTVLAALLLIATTGMDAVCMALIRLRIPKIIAIQLLFMYRYIHVLLDEFMRNVQAYSLRSFHGEGIKWNAWGSLVGHLLIRTLERAQRIYHAMVCRGFDGEIRMVRSFPLTVHDLLYGVGWIGFFLLARYINLPLLLGRWLTGGYS
jgi:cobalt/nickel transport system permease protein